MSNLKDLIEKLELEYGPFTEGCSYHLPEGWYDLVSTLLKDLSVYPNWSSKEVVQIKEKFGGLRFYTNLKVNCQNYQEMNKLISEAEQKSFTICQYCGAEGKLRQTKRYWVYTACEEHIQKGK